MRGTGLEPVTKGLWVPCSTIELTPLVGVTGFEPAALCSQSRCSTKLSHTPLFIGAKYQIRTGAKTLEGSYATITPISHMARRTGIEPVIMVRQTIVITASLTPDMELTTGLEPATSWLQISCSTNWATSA